MPALKPPRQDRSRETLERILGATERLLDQRPFDELTVEQILAGARVSVGSFYARFPSKEALLPALYDRYLQGAVPNLELEGAAPGPSLGHDVRRMVDAQVRRFRAHRGMLRTLVLREHLRPSGPGELTAAAARLTRKRVDRFMHWAGVVVHPDPAAAIERGIYFVMAVIREKILFGDAPHASTVRLDDEQLIGQLTIMLTAYLTGSIE